MSVSSGRPRGLSATASSSPLCPPPATGRPRAASTHLAPPPLSMYPPFDSPIHRDNEALAPAVPQCYTVSPPHAPSAAPYSRHRRATSAPTDEVAEPPCTRVRASRLSKSGTINSASENNSDSDSDGDDPLSNTKLCVTSLTPRPPPGDPLNSSRPLSAISHRSGVSPRMLAVDSAVQPLRTMSAIFPAEGHHGSMMMDHLVNADGMNLDDDDDDAVRRLSLASQRQRAMLPEDHTYDDVANVSTDADDEDATKVRRDSATISFDNDGNPEVVDHLTFFRQLGSGASGVVWHCLDTDADEERAVKAIPRRNCGRSNIATLPEVEVMKNLRHRNIVRLYECIDDPSQPTVYLVMQFVRGGAIATMAPDGTCTPIPLRELGPVLQGITSALVHCHRLCIVHGDVKPDNILVDRSHAGKVHAYLADFGVSMACYRKPIDACDSVCHGTVEDFLRAVGDDSTELDVLSNTMSNNSSSRAAQFALRGPGALGGTPAFLAPEVLSGQERTPASDMWALGVTIFCLLFGHLPFAFAPDGGLAALKKVVCEGEPTFPPEATTSATHRRWKVVIKQLLQKDPALRLTAVQLSRCKLLYYGSNPKLLRSSSNDLDDPSPAIVATGSALSDLSVSSAFDMNTASQLSSFVADGSVTSRPNASTSLTHYFSE